MTDRAGASIKTVSRVVNNEPNVRPETRERARDAATALKYEPLPAARGLAGRRTFSIGVVSEAAPEFAYIQSLLDGAYAAGAGHGHGAP